MDLIRKWATEDCHMAVAILISRLERESIVARLKGDTSLSEQKQRTRDFFQNVLERACVDERKTSFSSIEEHTLDKR